MLVSFFALYRVRFFGSLTLLGLGDQPSHPIRFSQEEIAQSLVGNWREELLFVLRQALELYEVYQQKIAACDAQVEAH
ncbi:MAG TPA: hypothetical protein VM715_09930, partial [Candidatus Acidoferrum sp.]|nr:hypothetical protein [Candidatus Acidoferrum sp.]